MHDFQDIFKMLICLALTKLVLDLHVKRWVWLCMYVFVFVQGLSLVEILASGSGSGIPLIQDIVTSNARASLSNATFTNIFQAFDWLNYSLLAVVVAYHYRSFGTLSPSLQELG